MHLRMARFLAILALLALCWDAGAQWQPPGGAGSLEQFGAFSMDATPGGGLVLGLSLYIIIAFHLFLLTATWVLFVKAGQPGWACLIPFYNIIVLLQIAGKPWWWFFLYVVPVVGFVIAILHMIALAGSFGKGVGYGLGLAFLGFIFVPLLAFGDAEYSGGDWDG